VNCCLRTIKTGLFPHGCFNLCRGHYVSAENPYRGLSEYSRGGFTYKCKVDGDFNWFTGYEEIFLSGDKIYELYFHGGEVGLEVGLLEV